MSLKQNDIWYENLKELREENLSDAGCEDWREKEEDHSPMALIEEMDNFVFNSITKK